MSGILQGILAALGTSAGGGGSGSATRIDYKHVYPYSAAYAMNLSANVDDVIILFCGGIGSAHATATVTGATVTMTEQGFYANTTPDSITVLTGKVTGAGTPTITISFGGTDLGCSAWIIRGLSSATASAGGTGTHSAATAFTVSLSPAVKSSLFIYYLNEVGDNFTSFNGTITNEGKDASHVDASGYQLDQAAGTYTPGVNVTSNGQNTILALFLPNA